MAVEKLLAIEIPPRAVWIRMMMAELNRVASHLVWMATNGMDLGATSMMIYGFRERELILAFFEKTAGLRMNLNYVRPGGVAADLPDGWEDDVTVICDTIDERTYEYDQLLTGQPIFRGRMEGVAPITAEEALALGVTGPLLRSTGVPWDLRRSMPYLAYDQVDFDVIVGHLRRQLRSVRDPPQRDPRVDPHRAPVRRADAERRLPHPGRQGHPAAARAHRRVDGGPDPPLQALHRGFPRSGRRGLLGHRVAPRRARLLPRQRRRTQAATASTCAPRAS